MSTRAEQGLGPLVTRMLEDARRESGFGRVMVCTAEGLPVASTGDDAGVERLAAVTSLFEEVLVRGQRDLEMKQVGELTLLDDQGFRLIVRPMFVGNGGGMFLVVEAPRSVTWRRATARLGAALEQCLAPLQQVGRVQ